MSYQINKKTAGKFILTVLLLSGLTFFYSCSSAPKRPMKETTVFQQAVDRYEAANAQLISFQTEEAGVNLQIAERLAISIDNAELLCKIYLSAIIYKMTNTNPSMNLPPEEEPFYGKSAEDMLNLAKQFSNRSDNQDFLQAISAVYGQKLALAQGKGYDEQVIIDNQNKISKDPYYLAYSYRTLGDIYSEKKDWDKAISAFTTAAQIHTKNRYLVEIGLDYFSLARVYSLASKKTEAIDTLNTALYYDKEAENTAAIASDYLALAKILLKGNPSSQEKEKALSAANWAAKIYESAGFTKEGEEAKAFAESIKK